MVVVIRLQGLKITAGSEDIRNFFTGLKIPDGGVHIIGGKLGEAFIMFASDEDARRAMTRSGGCIKGSPVNLLLSSKSEMQNVLEASSRKPEVITKRIYKEFARRSAVDRGPAIFNDKLDGRRTDQDVGNRAVPGSQGDPYNPMRKAEGVNGLYLHLFGMPFSCTKENVHLFFEGLQVDDIVFLRNQRGMFNGCGMVKFATMEDAFEGLKRDRQYIGSRFIKVSMCSEQDWIRAGGSEGSENTFGYDRNPDSGYSHQKYTQDRPRSRSPLACRSRSLSPSKEELCILLENLSYSVEKGDIKDFFHPVSLKDDQIIHVLDDYGKNLRTAILILQNLKDYCACLAHHKEPFNNRILYVSPLSKEKMAAMLESRSQLAKDQRRSSPSSEKLQQRKDLEDSEKRCLYVRNLPFDVRKVEITDFFHGFHLSEDKVTLLRDETGAGLGEALLIFQTEEEATMAQTLNGQRFLGSEVMLKCISWAQVREFGVMDQIIDTPRERNSQRNASRYTKDFSHDQMPQDAGYDLSPELTIYTHGCRGQYDTPEDYHDTCRIKLDRPIQHVSGPSGQQFNGPTCLKLINLPLQITIDEIYDFCYGYRVIPGSVSLQYDRDGIPKGSATVVFESHSEAVTAVEELSGRPIGTRKIKVVFI